MASANLIVKSKIKERYATVYFRLRSGSSIDIIVPTEFKVFPESWDNKNQRFIQRIYHDGFSMQDKAELKEDFDSLKNQVIKKLNSRGGSDITKDWMKSVIDNFHNKDSSGTKKTSFNQFIEKFIQEIESGDRLYDHNNRVEKYKPLTVKNYRGFQTQFNLYQEEKNRVLNFEHITVDFYDDYVRWFTKKKYSPNTIGRHVKSLKVLMRLAKNEGLHNNDEFTRRKFKSMKVEVQNVYLSDEELNAINALDLEDKPHLSLVRDVFLVGCYTAQRYSDYSRIKAEMIRKLPTGAKIIDLIQQKTGEQVLIPIRPELDKILKRYDYNLPKTYEQKVNSRIKIIVALAKITEPVMIEETRGGMKNSKQVTKNDLIKTHTARRSGCTNMYLAGIPSIDIMKVSGHKTEREFLGYIKVTKEETASSLSLHPYFNNLSKAE